MSIIVWLIIINIAVAYSGLERLRKLTRKPWRTIGPTADHDAGGA